MKFVKHSNLEGLHSMFSPSKSNWLRYDDEKLLTVYNNMKAKDIIPIISLEQPMLFRSEIISLEFMI